MNRDLDRILDEYLVSLSQAGSREAFEQLMRRWTPRLLRYAARHLGHVEAARDVVQDTWVAAIGALRRLDDTALFQTWIYRIAIHKCADAIRLLERQRRLKISTATDVAIAARTPSAGTPSTAGLDVAAGLRRLPEEQRTAIHLFYGEDLSIGEIAAILEIPVGTARSRLHHARESLRNQLGVEYERA
jgi:RNA polymerase sigma-70 factor (ECF subfamily)